MASSSHVDETAASKLAGAKIPWFFWKNVILQSDRETINNMRLVNKGMNSIVTSTDFKKLQRRQCKKIFLDYEKEKGTNMKLMFGEEYGSTKLGYTEQQLWSVKGNEVTTCHPEGIDPSIDVEWFEGVNTIHFKDATTEKMEKSAGAIKHAKHVIIRTKDCDPRVRVNLGNGIPYRFLDSLELVETTGAEWRSFWQFVYTFSAREKYVFAYRKTVTSADGSPFCIYCFSRNPDTFFKMFEEKLGTDNLAGVPGLHSVLILYKSFDIDRDWLIENNFDLQVSNKLRFVLLEWMEMDGLEFYTKMKELFDVLGIETSYVIDYSKF